MATSLEKCNVWVVTRISGDDGHRIKVAWFSDERKAIAFSAKLKNGDASVAVAIAWKEVSQCGSTTYYIPANGEFDKLPVDREIYRESGLKKLTVEEREALGV